MPAPVQSVEVFLDASLPGDIVQDDPPTPGHILILAGSARSGDIEDGLPAGFTVIDKVSVSPGASFLLAYRVVVGGDDDTWTSPLAPARHWVLSEWDAFAILDNLTFTLTALSYSSPISIDPIGSAGDVTIALFGIHTDIPGRECHVNGGTTLIAEDWVDGVGDGPYMSVGYIDQPDAATAEYLNTVYHNGAALAVTLQGVAVPPPVDPGYEPPESGHAILEIYVHDEDASRWDVATWGDDDGIIEGTEGVWSGAGWQDVTPQGVNAHVSWGTSRPERGILARQESQDWLVVTYDPDRRLDPGNVDGPYYPQLVSGVPIRLSSAMSGVVIRTGILDRISYSYKAPDYRGELRASSTIAYLYRNDVPADAILGDTLRSRIQDAVIAGGIAIGGIPVLGNLVDSIPDLPLSDRIEGVASVWEHVWRAGEEVGWVIYEDAAGTLHSRPWGGPADRGREITYENLEDLTSSVSDDGVYSVVRVLEDDGVTVIERVAAPLPRYGRIVYDERERLTTIDAESWADAVLADRAWSGVVWTPGTVWAFDQADVDYFGSLEIMERVGLVVPGVLDVSATVLGMELWVEQRTEARARWLFLPRLATAGSGSLGSTVLVGDGGSGDYLLADDGSGDYLEAD